MTTDNRQAYRPSWLITLAGCLLILVACGIAGSGGNTATPAATAIQITPVSKRLVVIGDVANLRAGPGVAFAQVGTLTRGTTISVVGVTPAGDWYQIMLPELQQGINQAWILSEFVGPLPTATPTRTTTPTPMPTNLSATATITPTTLGPVPGAPEPLETLVLPSETPLSAPHETLTPEPLASPELPSATATLLPIATPTDIPTTIPTASTAEPLVSPEPPTNTAQLLPTEDPSPTPEPTDTLLQRTFPTNTPSVSP